MKKHMTQDQEFEILKLVLDKFLWVAVVLMGFGFYNMMKYPDAVWYGLLILLSGAILLVLFTILLVREYHYAK